MLKSKDEAPMHSRLRPRRSKANAASAITVIFDADDTLWDTQPLYEKAKLEFVRLMERLGFPSEDASNRFEATDHANVSLFGFSKQRFPRSMHDTYAALCEAFGRRFDMDKASQALRIGESVFEQSPVIYDGVVETLSELRENGIRLLLATKGDQEVQTLRVDSSGLRPYFEHIYVLKDKGLREFQQMISDANIALPSGWSVGNSARSDINPALAAGLKAIWIHRDTWIYERVEVASATDLHVAKSITEVPGIVLGCDD